MHLECAQLMALDSHKKNATNSGVFNIFKTRIDI